MSDGLPIQPIGIATTGELPERTYTEAEVRKALQAATAAAYERAADANCYYCRAREWWRPINEVGIHVAIPGNQVTDGICRSRDILALINPADANALEERIRRERYAAAVEIHNALSDDCCTEEVICIVGQFEDKFRAALRSPKGSTTSNPKETK